MKRLALVSCLSASLVIFGVAPIGAQQPGRPSTVARPPAARPPAVRPTSAPVPASAPVSAPVSAGVQVAVIDINYVFKNHQGFNARMEGIKREIESFEGELRTQQKEIVDLAQKLNEYNPSSPEYKRIEEEATRDRIDIQAKAQLKKKDILEQEAQYYFEAYQQIQAAVQAIADRHSIGLVLRFDRDVMDPNDRTSVLKGVNRAVVMQRNLDITDLVLDSVNSKVIGQPPVGPAGGGVRSR
jgi:Skp family chaperone for outer membrane proteins